MFSLLQEAFCEKETAILLVLLSEPFSGCAATGRTTTGRTRSGITSEQLFARLTWGCCVFVDECFFGTRLTCTY
jgi:hypothetical protein